MPRDYRSSADLAAQQSQQDNLSRLAQLFGQQMKGQQSLADISAQGEQTRQTQAAKTQEDIAKEKAIQDQNKEVLEDLTSKHPHSNVSVGAGGALTVGHDASIQQMIKTGDEARKLTDMYGKMLKPYDAGIAAVKNIHDGLDQNSSIGDKIAAVNAARVAEGQGQRILQSVVQNMGLDPNIYKTAQNVENYFSSNPKSRLSPDARDSIRQMAMQHFDTTVPEYQAKLKEFQSTAPFNAPTMASMGSLNNYLGQVGSAANQSIGELQKRQEQYKGAAAQQQAAPQPSPAESGAQTAMSKLGEFFGIGKSAPAAVPPASPPAGMSFDQFKAWKAQNARK